ncbi:hypothetical protein B0H15DRAFT_872242 [Mycena belliarum]|uniref:Uncharacterized protein n=1 Tax=Mycena belliarum TaxID=1033014 RepID=A0AAD6TN76_9AGAR|nr:hypothetical protein B0H15DRAFT_872242 [Mycena belliae]
MGMLILRLLLVAVVSLADLSSAVLTNHTVDDADARITYKGNTSLQCIGTCVGEGWDGSKLYNGTVTVTLASTEANFRFVGSGIYVFFSTPGTAIPTAAEPYAESATIVLVTNGAAAQDVTLDMKVAPSFGGNYSILVYGTTMPAGTQVITISSGPYALDYLVYTSDDIETTTSTPPISSVTPDNSHASLTPSSSSTLPISSGGSVSPPTTAGPKRNPIGAIIGGIVGGLLFILATLLVLLLYRRHRRGKEEPSSDLPATMAAGVLQPMLEATFDAGDVAPPSGPHGAVSSAISASAPLEEQVRLLQSELALIRADRFDVRSSVASSGLGDTASVTRSFSTMKSAQTRAVSQSPLRESLQHSGAEAHLTVSNHDEDAPPTYR